MRNFNYSEIRNQKWDSDILGFIVAIYKEAGKQLPCTRPWQAENFNGATATSYIINLIRNLPKTV